MTNEARGWLLHAERPLQTAGRFQLTVADVTSPGAQRFEHHIMRARSHEVACLVTHPSDRVLLVRRHRFITDHWGWELPTGCINDGENCTVAAARVVHDDCGWSTTRCHLAWSMVLIPDDSDLVGHVVAAQAGTEVGVPSPELAEVGWFDRRGLREVLANDVRSLLTAAALLWWLAWS